MDKKTVRNVVPEQFYSLVEAKAGATLHVIGLILPTFEPDL